MELIILYIALKLSTMKLLFLFIDSLTALDAFIIGILVLGLLTLLVLLMILSQLWKIGDEIKKKNKSPMVFKTPPLFKDHDYEPNKNSY